MDVTKPIRQRGKVAELALGFRRGVGALQAMGADYGMHIADDQARVVVERWRAANPWCVNFWAALKGAADRALELPGTIQTAGRIRYTYRHGYLGGSLLAILPSTPRADLPRHPLGARGRRSTTTTSRSAINAS